MKRIIQISFLLLLMATTAQGQNAQYSADVFMDKASCKTIDCITNFFAGYDFELYSQTPAADWAVYGRESMAYEGEKDRLYFEKKDVYNSLSLYSYNKNYSNLLFSSFYEKGFVEVDDDNDATRTFKSKDYPLYILIVSEELDNLTGYTEYGIEVLYKR